MVILFCTVTREKRWMTVTLFRDYMHYNEVESKKTWCNGTLCRSDLTLSRLQHNYHWQPYARVDLNPMTESTLSSSLGHKIWPLLSKADLLTGWWILFGLMSGVQLIVVKITDWKMEHFWATITLQPFPTNC